MSSYLSLFCLLPLLSFSSTCLSCFCVAAALDACRHFLSTSDLQMSYMLRSSSTKPLARSWTMRSMTWPLCRCPVARFSILPVLHLVYSCLLYIFPCRQQIKKIFSLLVDSCLSLFLFFKYAVQGTKPFILFLIIIYNILLMYLCASKYQQVSVKQGEILFFLVWI